MKIATILRNVILGAAFCGPSSLWATRIVWTDKDTGKLESCALDGSDRVTILEGLDDPRGVTFDPVRQLVQWASRGESAGLSSCRLDGSQRGLFSSGSNTYADIVNSRDLEWLYQVYEGNEVDGQIEADTGLIWRSNPKEGKSEFFSDFLNRPYYLAVSDDESRVFWAGFNSGTIHQLNIESGVSTELITGQSRVRDLEVFEDYLYWTDRGSSQIRRRLIDGTGDGEVLFSGPADGLDRPHGLALDRKNQRMYWTDTATSTISSGAMDGSGSVTTIIDSNLDGPWGICLAEDDYDHFEGWQGQNFSFAELNDASLETTVWGAGADPDGDGSQNLEEYAFVTDPRDLVSKYQLKLQKASFPEDRRFRPYLEFPVRESDPLLKFEIQTLSDFQNNNWEAAEVFFQTVRPTEEFRPGYEIFASSFGEPMEDQPKALFRVQFTR